ncbi:HNH endonuclease [Methylobacterium sp. R2-1]|uniref:HNH endonuclease n=1 Tax=Methylobacterium sp. R2-1 TaxID=2587064 RepID=UPI0016165C28|nr:HNH endonuclease signature motif containing protein [Methylobacterium sp. R2-1]MBB2964924.1 5-methylcytosine-specific restriction endonuclease McrA [Methylobacterium sp. R2-1]
MSRTEFPKKVRRDAFVRAAGHCEGAGCGCRLTTGKFQYDHRIPDWMGGEPVLSNCQVLCTDCHKSKTKKDAADRAEAQRREDAHHGIRTAPHRPIRSAPMPKRPPQRRASSPLSKPSLPPRSIYVER